MQHNFEVMKFCVNEYLSKVKYADTIIRQAREDLEQARAALRLCAVDYTAEYIKAYPVAGDDALNRKIHKLQMMESQYTEKLDFYGGLKAQALDICTLSDQRMCVWYRRIENLKDAEIAKKYACSTATVRRWIVEGYQNIYYLMPEEYRRQSIPDCRRDEWGRSAWN